MRVPRRYPRSSYTVACLAGDGIGPEVMAEASRSIAAVSRLHGFRVEEVHVPFGGEALSRCGHLLPVSTRVAYLDADAVLVASPREPALEGVESELDLRATVTRVCLAPRGELTLLSPIDDDARSWAVDRGFELARSSRGRVASVGDGPAWRALVERAARESDGVDVEHVSPALALRALAAEPDRFDVVVTVPVLGEALADAASSAGAARVAASGRLSAGGPSVFAPDHGPAHEIAGQGVANPSSMLLAAALMLGEGLGERAAAETLAGAVGDARGNGARTPDMLHAGVGATTREFADVVLAQLPWHVTNAEFYREAVA
jgi:3-isopropylmalate dehydrogenase